METLFVLDNKEYVRTHRLPSFGKKKKKQKKKKKSLKLIGIHLAIDCIELYIYTVSDP